MTTETKPRTKKATLELIDTMFSQVQRALEGSSYIYEFEQQVKEEVKAHDRYRSEGIVRHLTKHEEYKYFLAHDLIRGMNETPDPKSFAWVRKAIFWGYSIYHDNKKICDKTLKVETIEEFNKLDYADMVKGEWGK